MSLSKELIELIMDEQMRQDGEFIPAGTDFLEKLSLRAEVLIHEERALCKGFVFFYCNDPDKVFSFITLVMVNPKCRGLGIGGALIKYVMFLTSQRGFKFCRLEVKKHNSSAMSLYNSLGFCKVEDRGDRYLMEARVV